MTEVFTRPASRAAPSDVTGLAGDQPGAVPYMGDPSRSALPIDENGDPVALLFLSDGTGTGDDGDLVLAVPNDSGGVDTVIASDLSASLTVGVDTTGLL